MTDLMKRVRDDGDIPLNDGTLVPAWIAMRMVEIAAWFKANGLENWSVAGIGPLPTPPPKQAGVTEAMVDIGASLGTGGRKDDPRYRAKIRALLEAGLAAIDAEGDGNAN